MREWSASNEGPLAWSTNLEWQDEGKCREIGLSLFFTEGPGETASIVMAKQVCNGQPDRGVEPCPVREKCLAWALAVGDNWAVLGGMSPRGRQRHQAEVRRQTGGRIRCRVCRRLYVATPNSQDCSEDCRQASRRRRDSRRRAS